MQLLKIEWLKLKKYRTFYILSGLFVAVFVLMNILMSTGPISADMSKMNLGKVSVFIDDYSFQYIWEVAGFYFSWAIIFVCVLVIVSISNEIQYKTRRQHIIDGQTRLNWLHSKVLLVFALAIGTTLVYLIFGLIMGYASGGGDPFHNFKFVGYSFLLALNYIAFSALLALLIKRSGLAIMILLAVSFLEIIIYGLGLHYTKKAFSAFLPLDSSDALFSVPLNPMANSVKEIVPHNSSTTLVIMSCVFIALYYFIARLRMQKTDL